MWNMAGLSGKDMFGLGKVRALSVRACLPSLGQLFQGYSVPREAVFLGWEPLGQHFNELQFQGDKCRRRHPGLLSQRWPVPGCLFLTLERLQVSVFFPKN